MTYYFRNNKAVTMLTACLVGCLLASMTVPASGHGIFKKTLEKKYKSEGLKVTCNMCHVKGEEKDQRNDVGELFLKEFEGKDFTAKWDALEGDEKKAFEKDEMAPAFLKALEDIYERETKGDAKTTYKTDIPAGKVEGTKLKKRK